MADVIASGPEADDDAAAFLGEPESEGRHDGWPDEGVGGSDEPLDHDEGCKLVVSQGAWQGNSKGSNTEEQKRQEQVPLQVRVGSVDT